MTNVIEQLRAWRHKEPPRQTSPRNTRHRARLTNGSVIWRGWWIFLYTALAILILSGITLSRINKRDPWYHADCYGLMTGLCSSLLYYLLPALHRIGSLFWHHKR
jgi:hypothetical protein